MFYYSVVPGASQTTNVTGGTENDCLFIKPGTRTLWFNGLFPSGKANGASTISGITQRLKKWTTTSASAGTGVTPTPHDPGAQASKCTAGWATGAVTSGTGGPTLCAAFGHGTSTPGPFFTDNPDRMYSLEGGANMSFDIFCSSPASAQVFEQFATVGE